MKNAFAATAMLSAVVICSPTVSAFAQAGSTGGSVGKTNKSVSGGGTQNNNAPSRTKRPSAGEIGNACSHLPGTWSWYVGTSNFSADHTVSHSWGNHGTWSCTGTGATINWADGALDRLTLDSTGSSGSVLSTRWDITFPIKKM